MNNLTVRFYTDPLVERFIRTHPSHQDYEELTGAPPKRRLIVPEEALAVYGEMDK